MPRQQQAARARQTPARPPRRQLGSRTGSTAERRVFLPRVPTERPHRLRWLISQPRPDMAERRPAEPLGL